MSAKDREWRKWTMKDWNEALFEHFFFDSDGEDRPVHRIPVTGDELLNVVEDSDANADEVQELFQAALRTSSHIEFNHRMSRYLRTRRPSGPAIWAGRCLLMFGER